MPIGVRKIGNSAAELTTEGGMAAWYINKTGAVSVKGSIVHSSSTTDKGVSLVPVGEADCLGVVYDSGVADGGLIRVVYSGPAKVLFVNAATREYLCRSCASGDVGAENGKAISEAMPTPPFATDKHFQELGHIMEETAGPGLALVNLHFN